MLVMLMAKTRNFLMKMPIVNSQTNHFEESSKSKPLEKGSNEVLEKTLQEDLNLSSSSIEDLIMSDDEQ